MDGFVYSVIDVSAIKLVTLFLLPQNASSVLRGAKGSPVSTATAIHNPAMESTTIFQHNTKTLFTALLLPTCYFGLVLLVFITEFHGNRPSAHALS